MSPLNRSCRVFIDLCIEGTDRKIRFTRKESESPMCIGIFHISKNTVNYFTDKCSYMLGICIKNAENAIINTNINSLNLSSSCILMPIANTCTCILCEGSNH